MGGHLARSREFGQRVHRPDLFSIQGIETDLLVCAGLPAEKWKANADPSGDWTNMAELAQVLATVRADRAVLISTVDVYQPPTSVDERTPATFSGKQAYGSHRAWFEAFFRSQFEDGLVVRLPGLFAVDVRKNLVHDLLHGKSDQWAGVNPESTFQFFDVTRTWGLIEEAWRAGIQLLNVTSEPVKAQQVADLFAVELTGTNTPSSYDMRSIHAQDFGGNDGYLFTARSVLAGIRGLCGEHEAP